MAGGIDCAPDSNDPECIGGGDSTGGSGGCDGPPPPDLNCPPDKIPTCHSGDGAWSCQTPPGGSGGAINCGPGTHPVYSYECPTGCCKPDGAIPSEGTPPVVPTTKGIPPINTSKFALPNQSVYGFYSQRTPEEIAALQSVTQFAQILSGLGINQFQIGLPAYAQAVKYYQQILGGNKAAATRAVAPQAEQIADVYRGGEAALNANPTLARSGARGTQLAELARERTSAITGLIPKAVEGAAQAAGSLGLAGMAQGAGNLGAAGSFGMGIAASEQQNRATAAQLEQSNRFGSANIDLSARGQDISQLLGLRGQDIQQMLGLAGIDLNRELGLAGLDFQKQQFDWSKTFQQQYFDWQKQQAAQQQAQQQKATSGAKWGQLLGLGLGTAVGQPSLGAMFGNFLNSSSARSAPNYPVSAGWGTSGT